MSGHDHPEQAVTIKRNGWSRWSGIRSFSRNYKLGYQVVPESLYPGPTFDRPAHMDIGLRGDRITLPNGILRERGDNTGQKVMVHGKVHVLATRTVFRPLLPNTCHGITMEEATEFHINASQSGWRALQASGKPGWSEVAGMVVSTHCLNNSEDPIHILYGRGEQGIFGITFQSHDGIHEMLAIEHRHRSRHCEFNFEHQLSLL